jgi:hypothetical protein
MAFPSLLFKYGAQCQVCQVSGGSMTIGVLVILPYILVPYGENSSVCCGPAHAARSKGELLPHSLGRKGITLVLQAKKPLFRQVIKEVVERCLDFANLHSALRPDPVSGLPCRTFVDVFLQDLRLLSFLLCKRLARLKGS